MPSSRWAVALPVRPGHRGHGRPLVAGTAPRRARDGGPSQLQRSRDRRCRARARRRRLVPARRVGARGVRAGRIVLRCDAATHRGTIWAGAAEVADHAGGYTPFEADITDHVRGGEPLRVTVRVGNELTMATTRPASFPALLMAAGSSAISMIFSTTRACTGRSGCIRPHEATSLTCRSAPLSTRRPEPPT